MAVSDTHSRAVKAEVPDGDVLLHAGDFTGRGTLSEAMQFNMWLGNIAVLVNGKQKFHVNVRRLMF